MYPVLTYAVAAFLGAVALLALAAIRVPALDPVARTAMRVGQLGAALVVGLDLLTLAQGHEVDSTLTHVGYGVAILGLPAILLTRRLEDDQDQPDEPEEPVQVVDEPVHETEEPGEAVAPPAHLAVLAVTAAAMVVLVVRLQQTW